jgi:hypothetical protein
MTERVDDVAVPVAVELVLRWPLQLRAELHRSRDNVVHVLDVDIKERRGAGEAIRRRRFRPEDSSSTMTTESPISISAWATVPSEFGMRIRSVAPKPRRKT